MSTSPWAPYVAEGVVGLGAPTSRKQSPAKCAVSARSRGEVRRADEARAASEAGLHGGASGVLAAGTSSVKTGPEP